MTIQHPFNHGGAQPTTFGYITTDHPRLDRIQNGISAVCGYLAVASVAAIAALTLWNMISRLLFAAPHGWIPGIIEQSLLVNAAFFGMVTAYRTGAHVAVASLFNKCPRPVQKALLVFSYLLVVISLLVILVTGLRSLVSSWQLGHVMPPGMAQLAVPTWIWKVSIPLACLLGLVIVLIDLGRELVAPWTTTATDYHPGDMAQEPAGSEPSAHHDASTSPLVPEVAAKVGDTR